MTGPTLRLIIDANGEAARAELGALQRDLKGTNTTAVEAGRALNELSLANRRMEDAAGALSVALGELNENTDPAKQRDLETAVLEAQVALDKEAEKVDNLTAEMQELEQSTDDLAGETADAATANEGAKFSFTELNSAIGLARQGLQLAKQAYTTLIVPVVDLAGEVRTLSRTIGATPEEASKLIQAAGDVGISADSLTSALEAAIRKGVKPTIEGLARMADEYNAIPDPIERAKYLMDNFGRSGADLAALMEKGADGIRAAGDEAERTGLVLGQDAVDGARKYEIAMDDLGDSVLAFKIALAEEAIPALTEFIDNTADAITYPKLLGEALDAGVISADEFNRRVIEMRRVGFDADAAIADLTAKLDEQQAPLEAAAARWQGMADTYTTAVIPATVEYTNQLQSQDQWLQDIAVHTHEAQIAQENSAAVSSALAAGLSGTLTVAQDHYRQVLADTQPQIDALNEKLAHYQELQGQTVTVVEEARYSIAEYDLAQIKAATAAQTLAEYTGDNREEQLQLQVAAEQAAEKVAKMGEEMGISREFTLDYTTQIQEANGSLAELNAKQAEAEAQLERTTSQFLFQQVAAGLTKEAQLELANSLGLIDDESYNAAVAMQELTAKYDQNGDGVIEASEATENYKNEVIALRDSITSMESKTVDVTVRHTTVYQDQYLDAYRAATGSGRAGGGPVYAGQSYWVGEEGPEPFFPASDGYIMNHGDAGRMVNALETIAGGGGRGGDSYQIYVNGDEQVGISVAQELELRRRMKR